MADYFPIHIPDSVKERFWAKVDVRGPDDRWEWQAARDPSGYGRFAPQVKGMSRGFVASRFSLVLKDSEVPPPRVITLHSCDNPSCVNPAHLSWGNHSQNAIEAIERGLMPVKTPKSHCARGHEMIGNNLVINEKGHRDGCRECRKLRTKIIYREKKAAGVVGVKGVRPLQTHCIRGHILNDETTRPYANGRACKLCSAIRLKERRARDKELGIKRKRPSLAKPKALVVSEPVLGLQPC